MKLKYDRGKLMQAGIFIWGSVGTALLVVALIFICKNFGEPEKVAPVLATLIATLGVVWSWFFQLAQRDQHHLELLDLENRKLEFEREKLAFELSKST